MKNRTLLLPKLDVAPKRILIDKPLDVFIYKCTDEWFMAMGGGCFLVHPWEGYDKEALSLMEWFIDTKIWRFTLTVLTVLASALGVPVGTKRSTRVIMITLIMELLKYSNERIQAVIALVPAAVSGGNVEPRKGRTECGRPSRADLMHLSGLLGQKNMEAILDHEAEEANRVEGEDAVEHHIFPVHIDPDSDEDDLPPEMPLDPPPEAHPLSLATARAKPAVVGRIDKVWTPPGTAMYLGKNPYSPQWLGRVTVNRLDGLGLRKQRNWSCVFSLEQSDHTIVGVTSGKTGKKANISSMRAAVTISTGLRRWWEKVGRHDPELRSEFEVLYPDHDPDDPEVDPVTGHLIDRSLGVDGVPHATAVPTQGEELAEGPVLARLGLQPCFHALLSALGHKCTCWVVGGRFQHLANVM